MTISKLRRLLKILHPFALRDNNKCTMRLGSYADALGNWLARGVQANSALFVASRETNGHGHKYPRAFLQSFGDHSTGGKRRKVTAYDVESLKDVPTPSRIRAASGILQGAMEAGCRESDR
jgi:hypothetical protein